MFTIALALMLTPQAPTTTPTPPADPKARICRKVPAPTGSRVRETKTCRTAAEWAALDDAGDNDVDAMRRRTSRQTW